MDFCNFKELENLFEHDILNDNSNSHNLTKYKSAKNENLKRIAKFIQMNSLELEKNQKINFIEEEKEFKIERYKIFEWNSPRHFEISAKKILAMNPLNFSELEKELSNFIYKESELVKKEIPKILINKGKKIKFEKENRSKIKFEKWINLINGDNHNEVLFTIHHEGEYDDNNSRLYYVIKSRDNKKVEIHLHDFLENEIRFEIFYNTNDHNYEYKLNLNKGLKEILFNYVKHYSFNKTLTKSFKKFFNKPNIKIRVEEENTKRETFTYDEDYREVSGEWYEITESKISYGHKYFENSKKRKYDEDWWEYNNSFEGVKEFKMKRDLDDGYGTKTNEQNGYKYYLGSKIYEFYDKTIENVSKGEFITTKVGFDEKSQWNSLIINNNTDNTKFVENRGKDYINGYSNEWYEKWYESSFEKFCHKWGKNNICEWEEEWKESNFNDYIEKFCYKKCKFFYEFKHWYETWKEKYYKSNPENVEKTCFKSNQFEEMGWGDLKNLGNEWKNYYFYKNYSDGYTLNREYLYLK